MVELDVNIKFSGLLGYESVNIKSTHETVDESRSHLIYLSHLIATNCTIHEMFDKIRKKYKNPKESSFITSLIASAKS